jgi:hypothetical protein
VATQNQSVERVGSTAGGDTILADGSVLRGQEVTLAGGIPAFLFPGESSETAIVVGGIHPIESAGIEVANKLVQNLQTASERPDLTTIVVPDINANLFTGINDPKRARLVGGKDLNRNLPPVGQSSDKSGGLDALGDPIHPNVQNVIDLSEQTQATTVVQLHGYSVPSKSGVTTDPRGGRQLEDIEVAREAALVAKAEGAPVPYNQLGTPNERFTLAAQKTNPNEVTIGEFFSSATDKAPAANVILVETTLHRVSDPRTPRELDAFAAAIQRGVLETTPPSQSRLHP